MKRLILIDFMKGIFIFCLLFFHALSFNIVDDVTGTIEGLNPILTIISYPLGVVASWAGFFFLVSGVLNGYMIYHQLVNDKKELKRVFFGFLITNIGILIVHFVYVIFFMHSPLTLSSYNSLIIGAIENNQFVGFSFEFLFFNSALSIIGFNGIIINIFIIICWYLNKKTLGRTIYPILLTLSITIIVGAPYIADILSPSITYNLESQNYFAALILSWLVGPRFAILPFIAYGLTGTFFGIMLARKEPWKFIRNIGMSFGFVLFFLGLTCIPIFGSPEFNVPIYETTINLIDLASMVIITTIAIKIFELRTYDRKLKFVKKSITVRKFGMFTLTIFIFEPMIRVLVAKLLNFISPGIVSNIMFGVFVYIPILFGIWFLILYIWKKVDFKFTVEWVFGIIIGKLRGFKSKRLEWKVNLYNPISKEEESEIIQIIDE